MGILCETGLKSLDELLGGGLPEGRILNIFGLPKIGKSWLSRQILFSAARKGIKSVYFDTESELDDEVWSRLVKIFTNRWPDTNPKLIEWKSIPDIFELGRVFGIQFSFQYSKEKVTVIPHYPKRMADKDIETSSKSFNWIEYTPIFKNIEAGVRLIVVDSFSGPIKPEIPSATQNWGARSSVQRPLLSAFEKLARLGATVIYTSHVSKNPHDPWDIRPWGGDDIIFYTKSIYGILPPLKADRDAFGPQARRLMRFRQTLDMEDVRVIVLQKDYGFISAEEYKP